MSKSFIAMIVLATTLSLISSPTVAQQPAKLASAPSVKKTIGFQVAEWKTAHFHDAAAADTTESTLKKLGCETQRQAHDGHIDLRYRCVAWKHLTVESDDQLTQWHTWLTAREMSTMVVDAPASLNLVTVRYQLSKQGHLHVHNADEAAQTQQVLEMMGCIVNKVDHNGHIDLTFSCPEWKTAGFPDHPTAHSWQAWLNQQGFTTEHKH